METFVLKNSGEPDLRFSGELLAEERSEERTGRWTRLELYRTKGGFYVCHEVGLTQWEGERDRYKTMVVKSTSDVIEFFGHGWLAKRLYSSAEIEDVVDIE